MEKKERKKKKEEEKIPHICESIDHRPLWSGCPKVKCVLKKKTCPLNCLLCVLGCWLAEFCFLKPLFITRMVVCLFVIDKSYKYDDN